MKSELRQEIVSIMDAARDLAIATVREDGCPQNTTVSFVHDGIAVYFFCGAKSQKAGNLLRDDRASITMTAPYDDWNQIKGLSMSARAMRVTDSVEIERIGKMMQERFPLASEIEGMKEAELAVFELVPEVISVLDYTKGFGHTDLVIVSPGDVLESAASHRHVWLPTGT